MEMQIPQLKPVYDQLRRVIRGKDESIREAIMCLLAGGHLLIEDIPGVGKTTLAYVLARSIGGKFSRIQFTSDLLPSDILGVSVYKGQEQRFEFHPGPVFANVVLADEINRTTPKTQSSLLESMERSHVTVDGNSLKLPTPFMVIATQNPMDFEGTFPLPENQLDRFLMRIRMGYPDELTEKEIVRNPNYHYDDLRVDAILDPAQVKELQDSCAQVFVEDSVIDYMIRWVSVTRTHPDFRIGVSPRGSIALRRVCQARALVEGRDFVTPEDVDRCVPPVFVHRIIPRRSWADEGSDPSQGVLRALESVAESIERP